MIIIKKELFDKWSDNYDITVYDNEFPFTGYEEIKEEIVNSCVINHSTQILDIGTGTGNFMNEFYIRNAQCYGLDFSERMIEKASQKMPSAYLLQHDLNSGIPEEFTRAKFSVIVSAYVFHHFNLKKKIELIKEYLRLLKKEDGKMFIVDVSFETREKFDAYKKQHKDVWDDTEYYFIAEEITAEFKDVTYKQFSECGGLYFWDISK